MDDGSLHAVLAGTVDLTPLVLAPLVSATEALLSLVKNYCAEANAVLGSA